MPLTGLLWLQAAFGSSCWLYQPLSTSPHANVLVDEFNVKKILKERNSKKSSTAYHYQIARKL